MVVLGTVLASGLSVLSWSEGGFLSLPHHWLLTAPERYVWAELNICMWCIIELFAISMLPEYLIRFLDVADDQTYKRASASHLFLISPGASVNLK